ncbi:MULTISPECIES: cbb3-type cytochrome oxidase subunit 3 [Halomonas]|uniref:Cytochrome c oxidase cbb3-type subunit 4 n=1 Tax=Halomonas ventosae TaxID=229007 RepID=A0A4R6HNE4_9GAMM|nr:cbb3-type cytochrome c oxidase subunit 3 [Halomonas ventosae]TDO09821.1 cytochrome c oxidase cbb3-type subunit 4 [Halomonas ventosae]
MENGTVNGVIIILLIIAFVGLTLWAYSKRRKPDFDEAANLPFADEDEQPNRDQKASAEADSRHDKGERNT